jgi:SAM-dependent methyltransferase
MVVQVLTDAQRRKWDGSDDALFYAEPRFVQHLDAAFRQRLTELYRERIPADAVVLDLMSSWVSHLPEDVSYQSVIGHGLNARELEANPRLTRRWVQNLNEDQKLPLESARVDATLIVAGWQYLQYPEAIAAELWRITRPGGQLIVADTHGDRRIHPRPGGGGAVWRQGRSLFRGDRHQARLRRLS